MPVPTWSLRRVGHDKLSAPPQDPFSEACSTPRRHFCRILYSQIHCTGTCLHQWCPKRFTGQLLAAGQECVHPFCRCDCHVKLARWTCNQGIQHGFVWIGREISLSGIKWGEPFTFTLNRNRLNIYVWVKTPKSKMCTETLCKIILYIFNVLFFVSMPLEVTMLPEHGLLIVKITAVYVCFKLKLQPNQQTSKLRTRV